MVIDIILFNFWFFSFLFLIYIYKKLAKEISEEIERTDKDINALNDALQAVMDTIEDMSKKPQNRTMHD